ncbi:MAG TPA: M43 family zinc metalloprotease [Bacteroidia bacterium]|nr:M43 family zinc metalloprotease [Bacteroidia bacterium]HNT80788.1 M43 family zinc metalloprotease [Bacteroidia bacterium]
MKKLFTLIVSFALLGLMQVNAQALKYCGHTDLYNKLIQEQPEVLQYEQHLEELTRQYIDYKKSLPATEQNSGLLLTIPVVFHVIHDYGVENISRAQIEDAVEILNEDFQKMNSDTSIVIQQFKNIIGNALIEFKLATLDPQGNCTDGIDRIYNPIETYVGDNNSKLNQWPRDRYLNVWVVNNIASGAAGYSQYPSSVHGNPAADGVMILHDYVGSIGTGNPGTSRALTHEVGHYLNLQHCWGSTNNPGVACGDDQVSDTPITKGWTSCNLNGANCTAGVVENVQNFMEYAYCARMFTEDQAWRMQSALNTFYSQRDNLWTLNNLVLTGTDPGATNALCNPKADFSVKQIRICEGSTVYFKDASWGGPATNWSWYFPGGTPSTSNAQNPNIVYNTAGVYDVTLAVSNVSGSDSVVRAGQVIVYPNIGNTFVPYSESFENITVPGAEYEVNNVTGGSGTFATTTMAAKTGSYSVYKNNFSGSFTGIDEMYMPPFNLANVSNVQCTFWMAHAAKVTTAADALKFYASSNCGQTWTLRLQKSGTSLRTTSSIINGTPFIPNAAQWRMETVNLATGVASGQPNARFKFEYTYDAGNNLYIDDININGTVGIDENLAEQINFSAYPNPSEKILPKVYFTTEQKANVYITVSDVLGRVVDVVKEHELEAGEHQYQFTKSVDAGIYFVNLYINNRLVSAKINVL